MSGNIRERQKMRQEFDQVVCFVLPIADKLGFVFSGTKELRVQLSFFLKEKSILIVLDNLEHLLHGIELLDGVLEHAPNVKIIATSREPLNLQADLLFSPRTHNSRN